MIKDQEGIAATSPYYCRGCGQLLSPGFRGQFHKHCLRLDKRRRIQVERKLQLEKFEKKLKDMVCPNCGSKFGQVHQPTQITKGPCERSQARLSET